MGPQQLKWGKRKMLRDKPATEISYLNLKVGLGKEMVRGGGLLRFKGEGNNDTISFSPNRSLESTLTICKN